MLFDFLIRERMFSFLKFFGQFFETKTILQLYGTILLCYGTRGWACLQHVVSVGMIRKNAMTGDRSQCLSIMTQR